MTRTISRWRAVRLVVRAQQREGAVAHRLVGIGLEDALDQRAGGAVVAGLGEQRSRRLERLRRLVQVVHPAGGDAQARLFALFGFLVGESLLPQRDQLAPALVALEQALEVLRQLAVFGTQGQEALQIIDRLLRLAGDILGHLCGLVEQALLALVVVDRVDGAVVERQQIVPPLGDREHHGEPLERLDRLGVDLEHASEHADQAGRIVGVPLLVELRGAQAELEHDLGSEIAVDDLAIRCRDRIGRVEIACE